LEGSVADEVKSGALKALQITGQRLEKELMVVHRRGLPAHSIVVEFVERLAMHSALTSTTS
jgi:hypothetical protein